MDEQALIDEFMAIDGMDKAIATALAHTLFTQTNGFRGWEAKTASGYAASFVPSALTASQSTGGVHQPVTSNMSFALRDKVNSLSTRQAYENPRYRGCGVCCVQYC